jgi:coatomer protein complex subunit epsilon
MQSADLYHVKQQFILGICHSISCSFVLNVCAITGAYKSLADMPSPGAPSSDYTSVLLYKARAHIALNDPQSALRLTDEDDEDVATKAVRALAKYVAAEDNEDKDAALEEQRDLAVEIEGDDSEGSASEKALVRVIAATAFVRAGETEEALETLGTDTEDLEASVVLYYTHCTVLINFSPQRCTASADIPLNKSSGFGQKTIRPLKEVGRG